VTPSSWVHRRRGVGTQSSVAGDKIPVFYTFARKMPEFYIMFARKIFFQDFFFLGGGGNLLAAVSYAYGWAPGPPPAKSGPATTVYQYKFAYIFCSFVGGVDTKLLSLVVVE